MNHIMLDLETLDTAPSAVILSIGAVKFDPNTLEEGPMFYAVLNRAAQFAKGRTVSAATIDWWMQQSDTARAVFNTDEFMPVEALVRFAGFINACSGGCAGLWGNGADFDNVLLASLYKSFDIKQPWSHRANRCYRTMTAVLNGQLDVTEQLTMLRSGTYHNALDDARSQLTFLRCLSQKTGIRIM